MKITTRISKQLLKIGIHIISTKNDEYVFIDGCNYLKNDYIRAMYNIEERKKASNKSQIQIYFRDEEFSSLQVYLIVENK